LDRLDEDVPKQQSPEADSMLRRAFYTGWLLTLALAWGCTSQTITSTPAPAIEPPVEPEIEAEAVPLAATTNEPVVEPEIQTATVTDAATGNPLHVTDADFEEKVLQSVKPVMVDVWAAWCGPCVRLAPTIDELAIEYEGRVTIAKLDLDQNQQTPTKYEVTGIPTMLFFKDGKLVHTLVGLQPKERIAQVLDSLCES